MDLRPAHDEFLTYLDVERARSPQTLIAYASDFAQFLCFPAETDRRAEMDTTYGQTIRAWIARLSRSA